jgi:DNA-binding NarL/FixJ family response regulator
MQPLCVVVLQGDQGIASSLGTALSSSFSSVRQASSASELRALLKRNKTGVLILDIESVSLLEVGRLSEDFPQASIVCTHRVPDEDMWLAALAAGAMDICPSSDITAIVRSALGNALSAARAAA